MSVFCDPSWQIVHFSLFPRTSTLWTNIDFSWSRRWTTLHPFWMSSSTRKSSNRTNTIQSGLCKPVGRRWGSSILVPYKPVRPAKTSSTKSLRKRSQDSLMPSRKRSECGGETPFLDQVYSLPDTKYFFKLKIEKCWCKCFVSAACGVFLQGSLIDLCPDQWG